MSQDKLKKLEQFYRTVCKLTLDHDIVGDAQSCSPPSWLRRWKRWTRSGGRMDIWKTVKEAVALYFEPLTWLWKRRRSVKYRPVGKW